MAKKDKKKSKKKKDNPGADAVGAVRSAVEKTFHATADSAQSTRTRAQELVDELAGASKRVREMIEQLGVLEDLKKQVESLAGRVAALERTGGSRPSSTARKPAAKKAAARKRPAAKRSGTTRKAAAKSSRTTRKPAAKSSRSTASRAKSAAKKPAAKQSS